MAGQQSTDYSDQFLVCDDVPRAGERSCLSAPNVWAQLGREPSCWLPHMTASPFTRRQLQTFTLDAPLPPSKEARADCASLPAYRNPGQERWRQGRWQPEAAACKCNPAEAERGHGEWGAGAGRAQAGAEAKAGGLWQEHAGVRAVHPAAAQVSGRKGACTHSTAQGRGRGRAHTAEGKEQGCGGQG